MSITIEVPQSQYLGIRDAVAREAIIDLGGLRDQLDELVTRRDPDEILIADCVGSAEAVIKALETFCRIANARRA